MAQAQVSPTLNIFMAHSKEYHINLIHLKRDMLGLANKTLWINNKIKLLWLDPGSGINIWNLTLKQANGDIASWETSVLKKQKYCDSIDINKITDKKPLENNNY